MYQTTGSHRRAFCFWLVLLLLLPLIGGCVHTGGLGWRGGAQAQETPQEAFSPAGFGDLLIPSELTWNREKSMVIRTESFSGGLLHFSGRVELSSLADYFTATMPRNNWRMVGSVKHRDILLAFSKPHKTAIITIGRSELTGRTEVLVYITDDLTLGQKHRAQPAPPTRPSTF